MKNTNAKTNRLKDFLNHVSGWVAAVIFISIGIVFIVRADLVSSVIIYAAAVICAALGVVSLISYFRKRPAMHSGNRTFAYGLALLTIGASAALNPDTMAGISLTILGVALAAVGYVWLQDALDARHAGVEKWWIYMIAALLSLLFAVLYFYSPITEKGRGLILLFEGICSLVLLIMRKSIDKTAEVERGEAPKTKAAKMEKAEEAKDEEPKIEKALEAKDEEPKIEKAEEAKAEEPQADE